MNLKKYIYKLLLKNTYTILKVPTTHKTYFSKKIGNCVEL